MLDSFFSHILCLTGGQYGVGLFITDLTKKIKSFARVVICFVLSMFLSRIFNGR